MKNNLARFTQYFFKKKLFSISRPLVSSFVICHPEYSQGKRSNFKNYGFTIGLPLGFLYGAAYVQTNKDEKDNFKEFGSPLPNLPSFKMNDIARHNNKDVGIWVSFRQGVYDITDFVDHHPGGDIILMAAGGALDPFWNLYAVHKQRNILEILEKYRIGNLDKDDVIHDDSSNDPYAWEPLRHPILKPSSDKPFNAEPPAQILVQNHITPQELFYVRNHLPVPEVDTETYQLEVSGVGIKKTKTFTMENLKKLPSHTITATVMCAGNRRSEMAAVKPVKGLNWGHAAVGNAKWTGVRLSDLLRQSGVSEGSEAYHVQFEGLDTDATNKPYGASIPLITAIDPKSDVLIAYEMNGEPLSRDHGFPVRVVVPGTVGARSVKWLSRIIVAEKESDSHWQQNDYKGFNPSIDWDNVDFTKSPAIQELPVISAICTPTNGETITVDTCDNTILVKGYAWSGGGKGIIRVDLTIDDGSTWHSADLCFKEESKPGQRIWDWTLWEVKIPLPSEEIENVEIYVKATDSSYNTQPESFTNIWNLRGVLNNAYHKVKVKINRKN